MDGLEYCVGIPNLNDKKDVITALSQAGMYCVGEGKDCYQLLRFIRQVQPEVVIIDDQLPGNVLEVVSIVEEEGLSATLLLERQDKKRSVLQPENSFMRMSLPVNQLLLASVVDVLYLEFMRRKKLLLQLRDLESKLQDRIVIEKAKGIVMNELSLKEEEAYLYLRKRSMDLRVSLRKIADKVLSSRKA